MTTVCICPTKSLDYPNGGGLFWLFLNWALGLRGIGCEVIWLEEIDPSDSPETSSSKIAALQDRLWRYGLGNSLALYGWNRDWKLVTRDAWEGCLGLDAAAAADLLLNMRYSTSSEVVSRFKRSALADIDPGLLQVWMSRQYIDVAPHDVYLTVGETIGRPGACVPDLGLRWHYVPFCVALDRWPAQPMASAAAPFTTVMHWYANAWVQEDARLDDKRRGFLSMIDLPSLVPVPLELAVDIGEKQPDSELLRDRGWRVRSSYAVASTPWDYQAYIQQSRGELSGAKPSYIELGTAWIGDRSLCYLASGKPVIVQYTGPSQFLPDAAGLFRFRDLHEAASCLRLVVADYEHQCMLARALAEEYFDATKVMTKALEYALA